MTLRNAPLRDGTATDIKLIWLFGKSEYFFERGWTAKLMNGLICPSDHICQPLPLYPEERTSSAPVAGLESAQKPTLRTDDGRGLHGCY